MSDSKLVLYLRGPEAAIPDPDVLKSELRSVGFLGSEYAVVEGQRYRTGTRFGKLLDFPPSRRVGGEDEEAEAKERHRSIQIPEVLEEIDFLGGANADAPSCTCGVAVDDWTTMLDDWRADRNGYVWPCAACGGKKKPWDLDWHHAGGFGRVTIDVLGIELGEATPSTELIEALERSGASGWDYYYYAW